MQSTLFLNSTSRGIGQVDVHTISASGKLNPRLNIQGDVRLASSIEDAHLEIYLRLEFQNELIGESRVQRTYIGNGSVQVLFEVIVSKRMLRFITDRLSPSDSSIRLDAKLLGHGSFSLKPQDPNKNDPRLGNDPEPGASAPFELRQGQGVITIDRAQWHQSVLTPTGDEQYRFLELVLPRSDQELAREWRNSVDLLKKAEQAYSIGDDAAVFIHLRGALDALPGAKQEICDNIQDPDKKKAIDNLIYQVGQYFHLGRHVSADGPNGGKFPVNRLDAAFALDLARTTFSHLSLMLLAETERASRNA